MAKYCIEHVCVSASISLEQNEQSLPFFVHGYSVFDRSKSLQLNNKIVSIRRGSQRSQRSDDGGTRVLSTTLTVDEESVMITFRFSRHQQRWFFGSMLRTPTT